MKIHNKKKLMIIIAMFMLAMLVTLQSPLQSFSQGVVGTDAKVYTSYGFYLSKGMVPYIGYFDQKGVILHILNFIGYIFHKDYGILIVEILTLTLAFYFIFKTSYIYKNDVKISLMSTGLVVLALIPSLQGGNLVEEYALPCIAIAQYYYIKMLHYEGMPRRYPVILGITCAIVLNLRVNMISIWLVYNLYFLYKFMHKKQYREVLNFIVYFLIGLMCIIIPITLYMLYNNALFAYIENTIFFNFKYSSLKLSGLPTIIMEFINNPVFCLSIAVTLYSLSNQTKKLMALMLNFITILLTFFIVISAQRRYLHYTMVFIPLLILPSSILLHKLSEVLVRYKMLWLLSFILALNINAFYLLFNQVKNNVNSVVEKTYDKTVNIIQDNTSEDDTILVVGNNSYFYYMSQRLPASKYTYQSSLFEVDEGKEQECVSEIEFNQPKMLIIDKSKTVTESFRKSLYEILHESYNLIDSYGTIDCYLIKGS